VPYDSGIAIVGDRAVHRAALALTAAYFVETDAGRDPSATARCSHGSDRRDVLAGRDDVAGRPAIRVSFSNWSTTPEDVTRSAAAISEAVRQAS
jgi:hypothetical protein